MDRPLVTGPPNYKKLVPSVVLKGLHKTHTQKYIFKNVKDGTSGILERSHKFIIYLYHGCIILEIDLNYLHI